MKMSKEGGKEETLETAKQFISDEKMRSAMDVQYGKGAGAYIGEAIKEFYKKIKCHEKIPGEIIVWDFFNSNPLAQVLLQLFFVKDFHSCAQRNND